jgi:hypothetical protein
VHRIQEHGIEVMAGFIVGFDSDPDDIFDRQVEFIEASAIPIAMVGLLLARSYTGDLSATDASSAMQMETTSTAI